MPWSRDHDTRSDFYFFHDDICMSLTDTLNRRQAFKELAVSIHVLDAQFRKIVKATRDHVAFFDLGELFDRCGKDVKDVGCGAIKGDFNEDHQRLVEFARVESCHIPGYEAVLFEAANALKARGRAEVDPARQLNIGHATIILQFAEDLFVDLVQAFVVLLH